MSYDFVIKDGHVITGTGNPWTKLDIAIKDGKISKVACGCSRDSWEAERIINAEGLVVSPGFIDMHSHSDIYLLINPNAESKVRQGITTEVIGSCGLSLAPVNTENLHLLKGLWRSVYVDAVDKLPWDWLTFEDYWKKMEEKGIALNVASQIGLSTVRIYAMGYDNRLPSKKEMNVMKSLVAEGMTQGAFGLSQGGHAPSMYASNDELEQLCKIVASKGGFFSSDLNGLGGYNKVGVKRFLEICEKSKVSGQISHYKVAESLKMIEDARDSGADITYDLVPYRSGNAGIMNCMPPWALEGGMDKLLERLGNPDIRAQVKKDIDEGSPDWHGRVEEIGWENIIITECGKNKQFEGKSFSEIANTIGVHPTDFALNLTIEEKGNIRICSFFHSEDAIRTTMLDSLAMFSTDTPTVAPYGYLRKGSVHPKAYGAFPKILGKYVREEKVMPLEQAIRKATSFTAQKLCLKDRGIIAENMFADIVIFDAEKIGEQGTHDDPHQYPLGVEFVLVNGEIVIEQGKHTGKLPGRVLRRT